LRFKNIALFASAVTSPKVPVGMATTTTADEMPEIRLQREDERKANEGITARYLAMYASITNCYLFIAVTAFKAL